jgi:competence protein ComEA
MKKTLLALLLTIATTLSLAAVDVNKATEADLDSIKGIGPSTSSKILQERKASPFKNWHDLITRVPGIGDKRAEKLSQEGLTVNGDVFKASNGGAPMKSADKKPQ